MRDSVSSPGSWLFWLFYFDRCGGLRALHSFPTRRSSDLGETAVITPARKPMPSRTSISSSRLRMLSYARSEEHTSELQSRGHLVCRLLLEKKKKQQPTQTIHCPPQQLHTPAPHAQLPHHH